MAVNLNLSSHTFSPTAASGDRSTVQQTRATSGNGNTVSSQIPNFPAQPDLAANTLNPNQSKQLDLVGNNVEPPTPTTNAPQRQISSLERQQSDIRGEQEDLQDENQRIERQIRNLEQQERTIDQRLNRLRQSQSLGQFVDLKA